MTLMEEGDAEETDDGAEAEMGGQADEVFGVEGIDQFFAVEEGGEKEGL